jgi:uncharacterized protein with HXXEE motif
MRYVGLPGVERNSEVAMIWSNWHLGWPWLCLGGGLVLFAVMFGTNALRGHTTGSRWWDPVWLAWLTVPMLMVHMFEEYGFDVLGRTYDLPDMLCKNLGYVPYPDCPIPIAHYPLVNLGIAWVSAPLAAWLARRNLVIGLSWYGLLIFNGTLHVGATIATGAADAGGALTGGLLFIPSFFWMIYVVLRSHAMSGKALAVSISGGIIAHVLLAAVYGGQKAGVYGATGVLVFDVVVIATPILVGWLGSKLLAPGTAGAPRGASA